MYLDKPISDPQIEDVRPTAIVLGGGISGITAAAALADSGYRVCLLETHAGLGGNQRSRNIGSMTFDIGSFVFFPGSDFFKIFPEITSLFQKTEFRVARITPSGTVRQYPYDMKRELLENGPFEFLRVVGSLIAGRLLRRKAVSAESYAQYHLGERIFRTSGLSAYIERLCGIPASHVDYSFAQKRMSWVARATKLTALAGKIRPAKTSAPQSLARPRQGFPYLFDAVRKSIEKRGVSVETDVRLRAIISSDKRFLIKTSGKEFRADRLISTIPLNITMKFLGMTCDHDLHHITLLTLYVTFSGDFGFDEEILYNFSLIGRWKRLTIHSKVYGTADGSEYFSVEIPCHEQGPKIDPHTAFTQFLGDIRAHGLLRGTAALAGFDFTEKAYPIYGHGAIAHSEDMIAALENVGVEMIGRQGRFDYIPTSAQAAALAIDRVARWQSKAT